MDHFIHPIEAGPDSEDLIVWPCGTQCFRYELHEMTHKSDDYEVVPFDCKRWHELLDDGCADFNLRD